MRDPSRATLTLGACRQKRSTVPSECLGVYRLTFRSVSSGSSRKPCTTGCDTAGPGISRCTYAEPARPSTQVSAFARFASFGETSRRSRISIQRGGGGWR